MKLSGESSGRPKLTVSVSYNLIVIGEQSEHPSDKLGSEIFISSRTLVCLSLYIYMYGLTTNTMPTHIVCAHSHLLLTLPLQRKPNNNRN